MDPTNFASSPWGCRFLHFHCLHVFSWLQLLLKCVRLLTSDIQLQSRIESKSDMSCHFTSASNSATSIPSHITCRSPLKLWRFWACSSSTGIITFNCLSTVSVIVSSFCCGQSSCHLFHSSFFFLLVICCPLQMHTSFCNSSWPVFMPFWVVGSS
jgi:hypothetical protein